MEPRLGRYRRAVETPFSAAPNSRLFAPVRALETVADDSLLGLEFLRDIAFCDPDSRDVCDHLIGDSTVPN